MKYLVLVILLFFVTAATCEKNADTTETEEVSQTTDSAIETDRNELVDAIYVSSAGDESSDDDSDPQDDQPSPTEPEPEEDPEI